VFNKFFKEVRLWFKKGVFLSVCIWYDFAVWESTCSVSVGLFDHEFCIWTEGSSLWSWMYCFLTQRLVPINQFDAFVSQWFLSQLIRNFIHTCFLFFFFWYFKESMLFRLEDTYIFGIGEVGFWWPSLKQVHLVLLLHLWASRPMRNSL